MIILLFIIYNKTSKAAMFTKNYDTPLNAEGRLSF